jgi:metallo-beta-lactamase family protein
MTRSLTFAGGAGTVTGSKYLLRLDDRHLLLDCGLFQGLKSLRLRNWLRPPFPIDTLDAVLLSHAHVDHVGYLPLLARHNFRGKIHCTAGTASLLPVVLHDAAKLQEEDARRANQHGYSRHRPAQPLFTGDDVDRILRHLVPHPYADSVALADDLRVTFRRAGHILGSASIDLAIGKANHSPPLRLVFSGDLGRWNRPILRDPELVPEADILLVESTYGDRLHTEDPDAELVRIIADTTRRGGKIAVPAFAIGRTQEVLWRLDALAREDRIPRLPIFVDSPMATAVTDIYVDHPEDHDLDMRRLIEEGRCPLVSRDYQIVRTPDESRALNDLAGPAILIAGSGMATGGRILHHLAQLLPDPKNTVLLPGFQAAGTRGRLLEDGVDTLRIHGQDIPVRARIERLDGLSAHADKNELLRWLRGFRHPPRETWVVHGEPAASQSLADAITSELGWRATVATDGATLNL